MRPGKEFWTDYKGNSWPVVRSRRRLKFKYPAHAALRAHVFHVDGYSCRRCGAAAVDVPANYDGHETLRTDRMDDPAWPALLVVDHVLTLKAGGLNVIENFQTLCEICNRKKQKEDRAATAMYLAGGAQ